MTPTLSPAPALRRALPGLAGLLLLAGAAPPGLQSAEAQSCTTIGASTFCGARGAHNTVGNTVIFNTGPAGRRVGNYTVTGTPPRRVGPSPWAANSTRYASRRCAPKSWPSRPSTSWSG